jgi:hypothetical protein
MVQIEAMDGTKTQVDPYILETCSPSCSNSNNGQFYLSFLCSTEFPHSINIHILLNIVGLHENFQFINK